MYKLPVMRAYVRVRARDWLEQLDYAWEYRMSRTTSCRRRPELAGQATDASEVAAHKLHF